MSNNCTYVALLRGINVNGKNKIKMSALRETLEAHGFKKVQTYIQSGNIIFESEEKETFLYNNLLEELLLKEFSLQVPVIVLTPLLLHHIMGNYPFSSLQLEQSYFTLISEAPSPGALKLLLESTPDDEQLQLQNKCVYFYSAKTYGRAKMNTNAIEKVLKVKATTRNYRTLKKLVDLTS